MNGKNPYEGMFLVDAGQPDFKAASAPVETVLQRAEAEVVAIKPWEERRLAYTIKGRRRGLYVLAYFHADPDRITDIERDVQLSEEILRVLVLRQEELTEEMVNADTPATGGRKVDEDDDRRGPRRRRDEDDSRSKSSRKDKDEDDDSKDSDSDSDDDSKDSDSDSDDDSKDSDSDSDDDSDDE